MKPAERLDRILSLAKVLVQDEVDVGGARYLAPYLTRPGGSEFESAVDIAHPNEITEIDIDALKKLSVHVRGQWKQRILSDPVRAQITHLLSEIPSDLVLEDVSEMAFPRIVGRNRKANSKAWDLWGVVYEQLKDAPVRDGRQVTAGKLLYAKRPSLLPIYDSQVHESLGVSVSNSWEATWHVVRNSAVRAGLESLRESLPEAKDRSLIRILDIVAWMDNGATRRRLSEFN